MPKRQYGRGQRVQSKTAAKPTQKVDSGFEWVNPSATEWPNVKGNPSGPRTQKVGYNKSIRQVQIVFRAGSVYRYDDVPPDTWNRLKRAPSTGKFINKTLNAFPYGPLESTDEV